MPVIEVIGQLKKGETFVLQLNIGKEAPHSLYQAFFKPDGEKFIIQLGSYHFEAHGESVQGLNEGSAKYEPIVDTNITLENQAPY